MKKIRVPKPRKAAYDPERPAGALLQSQLQHLEWAVRPAAERSPDRLQYEPAATEAEAADRIAELTRKLLSRNGTDPGPKPVKRKSSRRRPPKKRKSR